MGSRNKVLLLVASCLVGLGSRVIGDENRQPAQARILVAQVLGEAIYLDQIEPSDRDTQHKTLSKAEFDKWLLKSRASRLLNTVSTKVLADYAIREKLRPTREELAAMIADVVRKHPELVRNEQAKKDTAIRVFWLRGASLDWIVAKSLYEKYGGPIAISSFGAYTSIVGRAALLKEYADAGKLAFHHRKIEGEFWDKAHDERVLDVTIRDPKRISQRFAVSPWKRWLQELDSKDLDSNTVKHEGTPTLRRTMP